MFHVLPRQSKETFSLKGPCLLNLKLLRKIREQVVNSPVLLFFFLTSGAIKFHIFPVSSTLALRMSKKASKRAPF